MITISKSKLLLLSLLSTIIVLGIFLYTGFETDSNIDNKLKNSESNALKEKVPLKNSNESGAFLSSAVVNSCDTESLAYLTEKDNSRSQIRVVSFLDEITYEYLQNRILFSLFVEIGISPELPFSILKRHTNEVQNRYSFTQENLIDAIENDKIEKLYKSKKYQQLFDQIRKNNFNLNGLLLIGDDILTPYQFFEKVKSKIGHANEALPNIDELPEHISFFFGDVIYALERNYSQEIVVDIAESIESEFNQVFRVEDSIHNLVTYSAYKEKPILIEYFYRKGSSLTPFRYHKNVADYVIESEILFNNSEIRDLVSSHNLQANLFSSYHQSDESTKDMEFYSNHNLSLLNVEEREQIDSLKQDIDEILYDIYQIEECKIDFESRKLLLTHSLKRNQHTFDELKGKLERNHTFERPNVRKQTKNTQQSDTEKNDHNELSSTQVTALKYRQMIKEKNWRGIVADQIDNQGLDKSKELQVSLESAIIVGANSKDIRMLLEKGAMVDSKFSKLIVANLAFESLNDFYRYGFEFEGPGALNTAIIKSSLNKVDFLLSIGLDPNDGLEDTRPIRIAIAKIHSGLSAELILVKLAEAGGVMTKKDKNYLKTMLSLTPNKYVELFNKINAASESIN